MTAPAIQRRSLLATGPATQRAAAVAAGRNGWTSNPFVGIDFTPAFIGFAAYTFAIISYRFPIGTVSMVVALLALPMEKQQLRIPALAAFAIGLVLWALLGLVVTPYPDVVVEAVSDFAKVVAVTFVAVNVIVTRARFRAFVVGGLIVWVLFPLRGTIFSFFIYHGDVQGRAAWNFIYSNPNDLAGLCLLQLALAIGVLAVEHRKWVRQGTKFAIALLVLVIVLTQSRGAIIGLAAFGVLGGRKYFRNVRTILSLVVLAVLVYLIAPDSVWRRFSTIKDATNEEYQDPDVVDLATRQDQSSSQQRLAIWNVALAVASDNPVMGVGIGAYPNAHYVMAQRPQFSYMARGFRDPHSTYLNVAAETGIPGFALFAAMIIVALHSSRSARKKMQAKAPALALQLFNMEVGLYGYLVAAIWGSYGWLVPTYIYLALMHVGARLLVEHGELLEPMVGRRRLSIAPAPAIATASVGARA